MDLLTFFSRSVSILAVFLMIYLLALRKEGYFRINRVFLLIGLLASLIVPIIEIEYAVIVEKLNHSQVFKEVAIVEPINTTVSSQTQTSYSWLQLIGGIYIIGLVFLLLRLLFQVARILRLKKTSRMYFKYGVWICIHQNVGEPFVFGNTIFLKDKSYLNDNQNEVIVHEKVHLRQQHWIDMVLSEVFIAFNWFNPLAWIYARLIKQNLEFLADRGVLDQGFNLEQYIQTIICETMGAEVSVLANHFRFSQNKRRLKMMKNVRKSKWRKLKPLIALPAIAGFLWAFSVPVYEYQTIKDNVLISSPQKNVKVFSINGYVGVNDTMEIRNTQTNEYKMKIVEAATPLPGTSIVIKGTTTGTVVDRNGKFKLDAAKGDVLVFSFVGFTTKEVEVKREEELVVSLTPTDYELDPSAYRSEYKGKIVPPPPPTPKAKKEKLVPPPPPPPVEDNEPVFYVVEELPSYKGGMEGYMAHLFTHITIAKEKENLNGVVKVRFVVDTNGGVKDVIALNASGSVEAAKAEEIVASLTNWKPGKQRGKTVRCSMVVPVEFD